MRTKSALRAVRLRKRFERRVLGSHKRWQVLGDLANGLYLGQDGRVFARSNYADLYLLSKDWIKLEYFHPCWLRHVTRDV